MARAERVAQNPSVVGRVILLKGNSDQHKALPREITVSNNDGISSGLQWEQVEYQLELLPAWKTAM